MNYMCFHVFLLIIALIASYLTPYFFDSLVYTPYDESLLKSSLMARTVPAPHWALFRSPLACLFRSTICRAFSFKSPTERCAGFTHILLSQECRTNIPFGISPTKRMYAARWAKTCPEFIQKYPYPEWCFFGFHSQHPLDEILNFFKKCDLMSNTFPGIFGHIAINLSICKKKEIRA